MPVENKINTTYGGRPSMPLEDRAKIFSPFDPLAGFREALREEERKVEGFQKVNEGSA